jgi:hypothetical protein
MLSEQEIKQALRASRVVPMSVPNPHGPIGWQHLAHSMARFLQDDARTTKVAHTLEMPAETWQKLEQLADEASKVEARPVSASDVATAILRHYVAG